MSYSGGEFEPSLISGNALIDAHLGIMPEQASNGVDTVRVIKDYLTEEVLDLVIEDPEYNPTGKFEGLDYWELHTRPANYMLGDGKAYHYRFTLLSRGGAHPQSGDKNAWDTLILELKPANLNEDHYERVAGMNSYWFKVFRDETSSTPAGDLNNFIAAFNALKTELLNP